MAWEYLLYLFVAGCLAVGSWAVRLYFRGYWLGRGFRAADRHVRRRRRNRYYE